MKLRYSHILAAGLLLLVGSAHLDAQQTSQTDVPKTFSYQGLLTATDGSPLPDGLHTITVTLYGDQAGTQVIWRDSYEAQTTGGLFNLYLGSGEQALPKGQQLNRPLWVGTSVDGEAEMGPLTPLSSSPYALNVSDGAITGEKLAAGAVTADKVDMDYVSGIRVNGKEVSGKGTVLNIETEDNLAASYDPLTSTLKLGGKGQVAQGSASEKEGTSPHLLTGGAKVWSINGDGWDVTGGTGVTPAANDWIGTKGNTNFTIQVNNSGAATGGNQRVMEYRPNNTSANILGGHNSNSIGTGVGNIIAGGGSSANPNSIGNAAHYNVIGGGQDNTIGDNADWSTISGGKINLIDDLADRATISGGNNNTIGYNSYASTIAGGEYNSIDDDIDRSTIGGGNSNQILGTGSSFGTIAGGEINRIATDSTAVDWGTIGGGDSNLVLGNHGTVGGGRGNKTANTATVGGGLDNYAMAVGATIAGGAVQSATGNYSTISGGHGNTTTAGDSYIGGGYSNTITSLAEYSSLVGGNYHTIDGSYGAIGGGSVNKINNSGSTYGTIGGGSGNEIGDASNPATWGTIGGGRDNHVTFNYGTVGGGQGNEADNSATVGGGVDNHATGIGATIGGGGGQYATANYSTVSGGHGHTAAASNSTVGGGWSNSVGASADYSTVGGGTINDVQGQYGTVAGGEYNRVLDAASSHGSIAGGESNRIGDPGVPAEWGSIGGGLNNHVTANYGTIAGGENNEAANTSSVGGGAGNQATGFAATIGGGVDHIAQSPFATVGGGHQNVIPSAADNSTIGGGYNNQINTTAGAPKYSYFTIAGGTGNVIETDASTEGMATIGGGVANLITAGGHQATIPGGDWLIAQTWAQTVVGGLNKPKGFVPWRQQGATTQQRNSPIFIVGNGTGTATNLRSNAFEISYNGHSIVYDENGSGGWISPPGRGAVDGGTYTDNVIYGWAEVSANAEPGESCGDFGIKQIDHPSPGLYIVTLNIVGSDGISPAIINCGAVTATIGSGMEPQGEIPPSTTCAHISTSNIASNVFEVYITLPQPDPMAPCTEGVDLPFKFHVTGRVD